MSCTNKGYTPAVITPTLAAGSTASPYAIQVNISQRLCCKVCAELVPVFAPTFSLVGYSQVGTGQYVATVHVEGVIAAVPCSGNPCCTVSQMLSQNFTIPFASAAAPTAVSISQGAAVNSIAVTSCSTCSRSFVSETPITLTVTTTS